MYLSNILGTEQWPGWCYEFYCISRSSISLRSRSTNVLVASKCNILPTMTRGHSIAIWMFYLAYSTKLPCTLTFDLHVCTHLIATIFYRNIVMLPSKHGFVDVHHIAIWTCLHAIHQTCVYVPLTYFKENVMSPINFRVVQKVIGPIEYQGRTCRSKVKGQGSVCGK